MRHILGGLAMIGLLAAALPAAAQNTNSSGLRSPSAQPAPQSDTTATAKPMRHKKHRSATSSKSTASDNMADELNRQELTQLNQSGQPASGTSSSPAEPRH
jgi:hypothetical protein